MTSQEAPNPIFLKKKCAPDLPRADVGILCFESNVLFNLLLTIG
jgi:hypothetical protein